MKIQIGDRFNRLEVVGISDRISGHHEKYLICKCDCGNICEVRSSNLTSHTTRSCGCLFRQCSIESAKKIPKEAIYKGGITKMKSKTARNSLDEKYVYAINGGYYVRIRNRFMKVNEFFYELDRAIAFRDEMYNELQEKIKEGEING